jgi:hypothetical protein
MDRRATGEKAGLHGKRWRRLGRGRDARADRSRRARVGHGATRSIDAVQPIAGSSSGGGGRRGRCQRGGAASGTVASTTGGGSERSIARARAEPPCPGRRCSRPHVRAATELSSSSQPSLASASASRGALRSGETIANTSASRTASRPRANLVQLPVRRGRRREAGAEAGAEAGGAVLIRAPPEDSKTVAHVTARPARNRRPMVIDRAVPVLSSVEGISANAATGRCEFDPAKRGRARDGIAARAGAPGLLLRIGG